MMSDVSQGPPDERLPRDVYETRAKSALRQATWEATQYMTYEQVREYVQAVLREVESDEP